MTLEHTPVVVIRLGEYRAYSPDDRPDLRQCSGSDAAASTKG